MRLAALFVITIAVAGCGKPDPETSRLSAGAQVVIYDPVKTDFYLGNGFWRVPIGAKATVIEDDDETLGESGSRDVRINVDSRLADGGIGSPPSGGIVVSLARNNLRPVSK